MKRVLAIVAAVSAFAVFPLYGDYTVEDRGAWPHLLKVKSKGAPIVLRRAPNFWLGGASHGVCVHTPPADTKPLSAPNVKKSRWETTNYIELIVDGTIVDLNRIFLPSDTPIIDERFKEGITKR